MKGEETENPMQKYQEKKFDTHATCELLVSPLVSSVLCSIEAFLGGEGDQVAIFGFNLIMHKVFLLHQLQP